MSTIKKLEESMYTAERIVSAAERQHREFVDSRLAAARETILADAAALYGEKVAAAKMVAQEAHAALDAEKIRVAQSGEGAPHPVGTKLFHWESEGRGFMRGGLKIKESGIVEVVTHDTTHPDNKASYSRAKPGEFIVRLLKKDGTLGSKYEKLSGDWMLSRWLPEGKRPVE